jgi:hypothetical protein
MKNTAILFCEYLQRVKPDLLQSALSKFGGTRSRTGNQITYSFPDGSYAVMEKGNSGIIAAFSNEQ